jgi:m7GpppX diphosphatase
MRDRCLIVESPEMNNSPIMQAFISKEVNRPCKQWIHEVISSKREKERVKLRTPDFVLLPDIIKDRFKIDIKSERWHWLAVATEKELRTLRDLKGTHIPMLENLYSLTIKKIQDELGMDPEQIIAYIHYPPSVYQLHVHFKHVAGIKDTQRIHPLLKVIHNLKNDPEYYSKSHLNLPVYVHTELYMALNSF